MSFVAVAIGGSIATIGAGIISSNATGNAVDKQTAAADKANDLQKQIYDQQRSDAAPWRSAGMEALGQLNDPEFQRDFTANDFTRDPGYQFRMDEGQKALERSAAARGSLNSGGTLKAISRYGQDYASNEYQNAYSRFNNDRNQRFNRLSSIAGLGQTANNSTSQAGSAYGAATGANMIGVGNAQAGAAIANGNNWNNTIGGLGKTWMDYATMNRMFPAGG